MHVEACIRMFVSLEDMLFTVSISISDGRRSRSAISAVQAVKPTMLWPCHLSTCASSTANHSSGRSNYLKGIAVIESLELYQVPTCEYR